MDDLPTPDKLAFLFSNATETKLGLTFAPSRLMAERATPSCETKSTYPSGLATP